MSTYVEFMLTQNVTITGHYLSLCFVSLTLVFVLSVDVVVLTPQLDWLGPLNG